MEDYYYDDGMATGINYDVNDRHHRHGYFSDDESHHHHQQHHYGDDYSYWLRQVRHRLLAGGGGDGPSRIDYSVLSVGVMTLGLIMVVEVLRHRLDVAALGRPFFKAVLETAYAELSTLGVVELFIWLLHSYYDDLDVAKELVFAKVHFTLFYTAIFTAFQTPIVAFFANRVSRHLWVRTEALELNHYVEIREEFQRVSDQLSRMVELRHERRRRRRQLLLLSPQNRDRNKGPLDDASNSVVSHDKAIDDGGGGIGSGDLSPIMSNDSSISSAGGKKPSSPVHMQDGDDGDDGGIASGHLSPILSNDSTTSSAGGKKQSSPGQMQDDAATAAAGEGLEGEQVVAPAKQEEEAADATRIGSPSGSGEEGNDEEGEVTEGEGGDVENLSQRALDLYGRSGISQASGQHRRRANCCLRFCTSAQLLGRNFLDQVRFPHLKRKYDQLLVQVRFHELRVHFLQAYKLPLKLKISDYLLRSQLAVLIRLVHVSMVAWLLLTGATNLLYFVMGIVSYKTENPEFVGFALVSIYFVSMGLFLVMAFALDLKMRQIFRRIMHQEVLWDVDHDEAEKRQHAEEQLALFWFSDPNLVIAAIQFMQFCYAISLSVVLIFWDTIEEGPIPMFWYVVGVAISYAAFVFVVARVIPRYTLCTSLGQLVDEKRLHETLSIFHLQEAKLEELEEKYAISKKVVADAAVGGRQDSPANVAAPALLPTAAEEGQPATAAKRPKSPSGSLSSAFSSIASTAASTIAEATSVVTGVGRSRTPPSTPVVPDRNAAELMAELVRLDTSSLRTNLPEKEIGALKAREEKEKRLLERRKTRRRAVSDGVGAMAKLSLAPLGGGLVLDTKTRSDKAKDDFSLGGNRTKSVWDAASSVARGGSPADLKVDDTNPENLKARRRRARRRMKTMSDGVALMCMMSEDLPFPQKKDAAEEDNTSRPSSTSSGRSGIFRTKSNERMERRKQPILKSFSSGVGAMARLKPDPFGGLMGIDEKSRFKDDSEVGVFDSGDQTTFPAEPRWGANEDRLKPDDTKPENLMRRRRTRGRRQKSVSDGVALMSALGPGGLAEPIHAQEEKMMEIADLAKIASDASSLATPVAAQSSSDASSLAGPVVAQTSDASSFTGPFLAASSSTSVGSEGPPPPISPMLKNVPPVIKPLSQVASPASREEDESESEYVPPSLRVFVNEAEKTLNESTKKFFVSAQTPTSEIPYTPSSISEAPSKLLDSPPAPMEEFAEKDEETSIPSTQSVGYLSDIDDIPDVDPLLLTQQVPEGEKSRTLRQILRSYYLSKRFPLISNVFGTMVAFFMVGQRVECFLTSAGIADIKEFVKFDFPPTITFWILFVWFFLFLFSSALIFFTLEPFRRLDSNRERALFFGAVMDSVLTLACLACLCMAEVQRCCYPDSETDRLLAEEEYETESKRNTCAREPICSCPAFGSRLYGGYGNIEPFTSLIALRIFRHWASKKVIKSLHSSFVPAKDENEFAARERIKSDPFAVFGDKHEEGPFSEARGTITELWETAVGRYPEIVAEHGEFSGELLRAMLGVPVPKSEEKYSPDRDGSLSAQNSTRSMVDNQVTESNRQPFSLEMQYSGLLPQAQEIILAGRLGRTVKSQSQQQLFHPDDLHPSIPEEEEAFHGEPKLVFEIDLATPQLDSMFASPNARLVRNMRRCDRKVLPFLDNWNVVDVVLTRHEVVYFDAAEADNVTIEVGSNAEGLKQALVATKGGKGLRLCDVATGRSVVGLLQLTDIESVHVERVMPHQLRPGDYDSPAIEVNRTEYWYKRASSERTLDRGTRWSNTVQDILRIKTVNGRTICLRFYSDLQDAEAHPEKLSSEDDAMGGQLYKNLALQWAQTIIRFCGPELKQPLPHFGDDSNDELRDFLVVKQDDVKAKESRHRRMFSEGTGDRNLLQYLQNALPRRTDNSNDETPHTSHHRSFSLHISGARELSSKEDQPLKRSFHYVGEFTKVEGGKSGADETAKKTGNDQEGGDQEGGNQQRDDQVPPSDLETGLPDKLRFEENCSPQVQTDTPWNPKLEEEKNPQIQADKEEKNNDDEVPTNPEGASPDKASFDGLEHVETDAKSSEEDHRSKRTFV